MGKSSREHQGKEKAVRHGRHSGSSRHTESSRHAEKSSSRSHQAQAATEPQYDDPVHYDYSQTYSSLAMQDQQSQEYQAAEEGVQPGYYSTEDQNEASQGYTYTDPRSWPGFDSAAASASKSNQHTIFDDDDHPMNPVEANEPMQTFTSYNHTEEYQEDTLDDAENQYRLTASPVPHASYEDAGEDITASLYRTHLTNPGQTYVETDDSQYQPVNQQTESQSYGKRIAFKNVPRRDFERTLSIYSMSLEDYIDVRAFIDTGNFAGHIITTQKVLELGYTNEDIAWENVQILKLLGKRFKTFGSITLDACEEGFESERMAFRVVNEDAMAIFKKRLYEVLLKPADSEEDDERNMEVHTIVESKRKITEEEKEEQRQLFIEREEKARKQAEKLQKREGKQASKSAGEGSSSRRKHRR